MCICALECCRLLIFMVVAVVALRTTDKEQRTTALEILKLCAPRITGLVRKRE